MCVALCRAVLRNLLTRRGQFGPDATYLRSALPMVMQKYNINRQRVALAGFSDGATVAISLLPLGSVASHIIAFSPGGFAPPLVVSLPQQLAAAPAHTAPDADFCCMAPAQHLRQAAWGSGWTVQVDQPRLCGRIHLTPLTLRHCPVACVRACTCVCVFAAQNGRPKVAVFHGTKDQLFPIDKTARPIVQQVAQRLPSSEINYQEHQGAHEAPPAVVQQGLEWFLNDKPVTPTKFARKGTAAPAAGRSTASERGGLLSRLG